MFNKQVVRLLLLRKRDGQNNINHRIRTKQSVYLKVVLFHRRKWLPSYSS